MGNEASVQAQAARADELALMQALLNGDLQVSSARGMASMCACCAPELGCCTAAQQHVLRFKHAACSVALG
jgi:hypothetical protein